MEKNMVDTLTDGERTILESLEDVDYQAVLEDMADGMDIYEALREEGLI